MSRSLKPLLATLALALYFVSTLGCFSAGGGAQVRIVNAVPDSQPIDVYINSTRVATAMAFNTFQPNANPAKYIGVPTGTESIQGFLTGTTINPVSPSGTLSLTSNTQYTIVAVGLELNTSPPLLLTDVNTLPTSGNVEFRIINASPSSPVNGVDVYLVPPGTDITDYTPQISLLNNGQASSYQSLTYTASGYEMIVTPTGTKVPLIHQTYIPNSASITTLVLVDNAGGNNGLSQTPLVLNDLN